MTVVPINPAHPDPAAIAAASDVLRKGGVIVYPTDTCYGIGADPHNTRAVARIAAMKRRDERKKYSVIVNGIAGIERVAILTDSQRAALERSLPGPFTFVLLAADLQLLGSNTVGIRVPDHEVTRQLAVAFGAPFISTSANLTGEPALYSYEAIREEFLGVQESSNLPDLVLDAGTLPDIPPSTIVDLTCTPPVIIRQGAAPFP